MKYRTHPSPRSRPLGSKAPRITHRSTTDRRHTIGKIVNSTFVSLDGVINHMDRWHVDFVDAETNAFALQQLRESDAPLMGRHTYDVYAGSWPGRDGDFADRINAMTKYVASNTLKTAAWANSTVLEGDLIEAVTKLKKDPGHNILMHGYGRVDKSLVQHSLLDELFLWVHPMLAGIGASDDLLLSEGLIKRHTLLNVQRLSSGVVILSYKAN